MIGYINALPTLCTVQCAKCYMRITQIVKGMTNMRPTAEVRSFARSLIFHHAVYDKFSSCYVLSIHDLSCFDLHELASLIMNSDDCAPEATGPDNPAYEKTMLPALKRYLSNSTDKDEEIEFTKTWRDGVTSYFHKQMQALVDEECCDYSNDKFNDAGLYARKSPDSGEMFWNRY